VSPDGSQIATGYHDGNMHILPTSVDQPSSSHLQRSKPHLSTVTSVRFFPSSRVLLTAGNDFTLCILPAEPVSADSPGPPPILTPARTLRAHTRAITSTAILERGRNVLSAAKDGTVRLWDVGAGAQIRSMAAIGHAPIQAMAVGGRGESAVQLLSETPAGAPSTLPEGVVEAGTRDTLAFCALDDGTFEVFEIGTGASVFRSPTRGVGLTSIAYSEQHHTVATGSSKGVVSIWDTRSLGAPVVQFTRGTPAVEDLTIVDIRPCHGTEAPHLGLAIATSDALPFVASIRPEGPQVEAELIGSDCDRVGHVRVQGAGEWGGGRETLRIWTAADDGVIRRY
jgi:proteasomal ATPase-associated factor 1